MTKMGQKNQYFYAPLNFYDSDKVYTIFWPSHLRSCREKFHYKIALVAETFKILYMTYVSHNFGQNRQNSAWEDLLTQESMEVSKSSTVKTDCHWLTCWLKLCVRTSYCFPSRVQTNCDVGWPSSPFKFYNLSYWLPSLPAATGEAPYISSCLSLTWSIKQQHHLVVGDFPVGFQMGHPTRRHCQQRPSCKA